MQYENKILNFHIYLYFPSNIFKKFKNIKIKGLTYYILTCIISLVFTRNKSKHTIQYARVAQWWSILNASVCPKCWKICPFSYVTAILMISSAFSTAYF